MKNPFKRKKKYKFELQESDNNVDYDSAIISDDELIFIIRNAERQKQINYLNNVLRGIENNDKKDAP